MVLLDTHVLIWTITDSHKLSKNARAAIREARAESSVAIADFTLWELAWLLEHKRISVPGTLESFLHEATEKVVVKPITAEIAALAARLPGKFPKDPGDRLIASTAISQGVPLVTADEGIRRSKVVCTVW